MRALTSLAVLMVACGHVGDAATAFAGLDTLEHAPARVANARTTIEDVSRHPYKVCNPTRPDLAPYLRGMVVLSGPLGLEPVAFTEVHLERDGATVRSAATDRSGVFSFSCGLAPGVYDIVLRDDGYRGNLTVVLPGRASNLLLLAVRR